MLEKEANSKATDCLGNTALHLAVQISNNSETITYLVEQVKLDVNSKNEENQTALHLVTYYGYMPTVEYLVEHGAQVSISTFYKQLFSTKAFCTAIMSLQFGLVNFWQKKIGANAVC